MLLAIPAVGSVYPVPPAPVMYFPYLFLAYLAVGIVWILSFYRRQPPPRCRSARICSSRHDRFTGDGGRGGVSCRGQVVEYSVAAGVRRLPSPDAVSPRTACRGDAVGSAASARAGRSL